MAKRVFYVVYFDDRDVQRCLDAIRLFCNPAEKSCAHITVRGPYQQRYNLKAATTKIQGSLIFVENVGTFFDGSQNTVFLKCSSNPLREISMKRDYGYNPHITLYDGGSRGFAVELVKKLSTIDLRFTCRADGLSPLVSVKGQQTFDLRTSFDSDFVTSVVGENFSLTSIDDLNTNERLTFIELLAKELPRFSRTSREFAVMTSNIKPHGHASVES